MKSKRQLTAVLLSLAMVLLLVVAAGCGGAPEKKQETKQESPKVETAEINVSAAVSMKDALEEIQGAFQKENPNIKLIFNLGASGTLQKQIEQGAPADIFISAAPKQMNELEEKNLIKKETRKDLVKNELVLIMPNNSTLNLKSYEDLCKTEIDKLCIGEPEVVPAGQYAKQVLTKIGIWEEVQGKAVLAKDVRTVLTYVETGNVAAGIVYKTDAVSSDKVKIVTAAPEGSHNPIVYPIAILVETKKGQEAESFYSFLLSDKSRPILEKYGFTVVK